MFYFWLCTSLAETSSGVRICGLCPGKPARSLEAHADPDLVTWKLRFTWAACAADRPGTPAGASTEGIFDTTYSLSILHTKEAGMRGHVMRHRVGFGAGQPRVTWDSAVNLM